MVKRTDFAENVILTGTVSILADPSGSNGDGCLEVFKDVHADVILSNTDILPVAVESVEFKNKNMTMQENADAIADPAENKVTFYVNNGVLKSKNSLGSITTYQPLTTKGDLLSHNGVTQIRIPTGTTGQVLKVDPTTSSGLKWETSSSGTGLPSDNNVVTLTGNNTGNSQLISKNVSGSYFGLLSTSTRSGPVGGVFASKNRHETQGNIVQLVNSPSLTTSGILQYEYNPYEPIRVYKESLEGDGDYPKTTSDSFTKNSITLSGTTWLSLSSIFPETKGAVSFSVGSSNRNFPVASFIASKSASTQPSANITRISSAPSSDNCELSIRWQSSSSIQIRKSNNFNDGEYYVINNFEFANVETLTINGTGIIYLPEHTTQSYEKKTIFVKINNQTENFPCSVSMFSKNSRTTNGNFFNVFAPGSVNNTRIRPLWNANSSVGFSKNNSSYDGDYEISYYYN